MLIFYLFIIGIVALMDDERIKILERFRKIIEESRLKKNEIIEKAPYPRSSFFKVLKGDKLPNIDDLLNLCKLLNKNILEFFTDDFEKNQLIKKERDDYKEKYFLAKSLLDVHEDYKGNKDETK